MKGHSNCSGHRGWFESVFCRQENKKSDLSKFLFFYPYMEGIHLLSSKRSSMVYCKLSVREFRKLRNQDLHVIYPGCLQFCRQKVSVGVGRVYVGGEGSVLDICYSYLC